MKVQKPHTAPLRPLQTTQPSAPAPQPAQSAAAAAEPSAPAVADAFDNGIAAPMTRQASGRTSLTLGEAMKLTGGTSLRENAGAMLSALAASAKAAEGALKTQARALVEGMVKDPASAKTHAETLRGVRSELAEVRGQLRRLARRQNVGQSVVGRLGSTPLEGRLLSESQTVQGMADGPGKDFALLTLASKLFEGQPAALGAIARARIDAVPAAERHALNTHLADIAPQAAATAALLGALGADAGAPQVMPAAADGTLGQTAQGFAQFAQACS